MALDDRWEQLEKNEEKLFEDMEDEARDALEPLLGDLIESVDASEDLDELQVRVHLDQDALKDQLTDGTKFDGFDVDNVGSNINFRLNSE